MDKSNVIHLKLKANLIRKPTHASLSTSSDKSQAVMASGALATTLALVFALNLQISKVSQNETSSGRGPASARGTEAALSTDNLAKTLSERWARQPASLGKTSVLDQLRSGLLEDKYVIRLQDQRVWAIEFSANAADRPKYINDKEEFLQRYKSVLGPSFEKPLLLGEKLDQGRIITRFQLIDESAKPVATAIFESDESDRMLRFEVVK